MMDGQAEADTDDEGAEGAEQPPRPDRLEGALADGDDERRRGVGRDVASCRCRARGCRPCATAGPSLSLNEKLKSLS